MFARFEVESRLIFCFIQMLRLNTSDRSLMAVSTIGPRPQKELRLSKMLTRPPLAALIPDDDKFIFSSDNFFLAQQNAKIIIGTCAATYKQIETQLLFVSSTR